MTVTIPDELLPIINTVFGITVPADTIPQLRNLTKEWLIDAIYEYEMQTASDAAKQKIVKRVFD